MWRVGLLVRKVSGIENQELASVPLSVNGAEVPSRRGRLVRGRRDVLPEPKVRAEPGLVDGLAQVTHNLLSQRNDLVVFPRLPEYESERPNHACQGMHEDSPADVRSPFEHCERAPSRDAVHEQVPAVEIPEMPAPTTMTSKSSAGRHAPELVRMKMRS